jgi:predicted O-methyltransferase YrrM
MSAGRFSNVFQKVIRRGVRLSGDINGDSDSALAALLKVYDERSDLQEVYPEARTGNYARLIDWAAGVSNKKWKDSSFPSLEPFARWYAARFTATPPSVAVVWPDLLHASAASGNPLSLTVQIMRDDSSADISNHLPVLSMLITEFGLRNIVELGVRAGNSTLVLLEAARRIGGRVLSIDVEPCLEARTRVDNAGFSDIWKFLEGSDLDVSEADIPQPIDLLFIDTSHLYGHTVEELKKYSPYLSKGAWIAFHDYVSFPGVTRAVHEFVQSLSHKASFYPLVHQNGLALIRIRPSENGH